MRHDMKYLACVCICCVSVCLHGCAMEEQKTLREGRLLEEQGDYISAMRHYEQFKDPGFAQTNQHNLRVLYGDMLDAMEEINRAEDSPEAHFALGEAYYEKAGTIPEPDDVEANFGFDSASYFSRQKEHYYRQAEKELKTATQLRPEYVEALLIQGATYEETERPLEAIDIYQQLVNQEADPPEVYYRLGYLLYEQEKFRQGLDMAKHGVSRYPQNARAHFVLADLYSREGEAAHAVAEFNQVLCLNPQGMEAYYRLAQTYLNDGNMVDAARVLRRGISQNPEALQLKLFYSSLKNILDYREQQKADEIFNLLEGENLPDDMNKVNWAEQGPGVELRYLRLRQQLIARYRPYHLPCLDREENPYFENQLEHTQARIEEIEQALTPEN